MFTHLEFEWFHILVSWKSKRETERYKSQINNANVVCAFHFPFATLRFSHRGIAVFFFFYFFGYEEKQQLFPLL